MSIFAHIVDWASGLRRDQESRPADMPTVRSRYDQQREAWAAYGAKVRELREEALANAPVDRYRIWRDAGSGEWRIDVWGEYGGGIYHPYGMDHAPPEPAVYFFHSPMNDFKFPSREAAETWLSEFLHPEDRSFGYGADGKPITKASGANGP
jgi:hypothetical protein